MRWAIFLAMVAIATKVRCASITEARSILQDVPAQTIIENIIPRDDEEQQCITKPNVCLTKGCVKAASAMIDRMNMMADPCNDFFEFSCGSFVKNSVIPNEKSGVTTFSIVTDELQAKLRRVVKQEVSDKDSTPIKMVKNLFQSCMNIEAIEKSGIKPLTDILDRMGGWPVIEGDTWDETKFSWQQAVYNNRREGYSIDTLINFSVNSDLKNSSWRIMWLDQASLGLSREYLTKGVDDSDVKAYLQYSIDIALLLGANKVRAEKELTEVLQFHIELANISTPREDRRNATKLYNLYTLKQLAVEFPEIPFVTYINSLMVPSIQIDETETVGLSDINYLRNLTRLLAKTPKRIIANYMLWRVAEASSSYLPKDFRDAQLKYSKVLTGRTERPPRWKECIGITSSRLSYAMSNLYVNNFFKDEAKQDAVELVDYIRREFDDILNTIEWMDPITRKNALSKAATIKSHMAYPPEIMQPLKIMEFYGDLQVDNGSLLHNLLRCSQFSTNYSFSRLRKKIDKNDWKRQGRVAIVNAFYSAVINAITFPAGILQGVFFESDRPKYMNFGGIGFVIGHEITHGFDDQGKQFDADGNLKNWWQAETEKKFLQKTKCVIEQYGNYTAPENGLNLNGINTQGENIADIGGIKEAYGAYLRWLRDNKEEGVLPGMMEYSTKQLFWVSAAQVWCSKYRPEALKIRIVTGVHSPGRFRVQGPFSNSPEFARDWNCPLGSNMNPAKKCNVW